MWQKSLAEGVEQNSKESKWDEQEEEGGREEERKREGGGGENAWVRAMEHITTQQKRSQLNIKATGQQGASR